MFGLGMFGGAPSSPWGGMKNAFAMPRPGGPAGQGAGYQMLGQAAGPLQQMGQPRFAGQPMQENPVAGLQGFKPAVPGGAGGAGPMFGGVPLSGMPQGLPPWLLERLRQMPVGQGSQGPNVFGPQQPPAPPGLMARLFPNFAPPQGGYR